jgi:hypothetical protein
MRYAQNGLVIFLFLEGGRRAKRDVGERHVCEGLELLADTFRGNRQLAALGDLDRLGRLVTRLGLRVLNLLYHLVTLENLAEDDVLAIEPPVLFASVTENPFSFFLFLSFFLFFFFFFLLGATTYEVTMVVMKNWDPLVSLPALAMESKPFLVCLSLKFSSGNLAP